MPLLLSWKLWRILHQPAYSHVLYRRSIEADPLALFRPLLDHVQPRIWTALAVLVALYIVVRVGITSILVSFFLLPGIIISAFVFLPLILPFVTIVIGSYWSATISSSVLRQRDAHTYDLLCLGPNGTLGANWSIAHVTLQRGGVFGTLHMGSLVSFVLGSVALLLMLAIFLYMLVTGAGPENVIAAGRTVLDMLALLLGFGMHYIQSVVLAVMVGLYAPTLMGRDAPWVSFGLYLALQIGTYGILALLYHLLTPYAALITPDLPLAYLSPGFEASGYEADERRVMISSLS